MEVPETLPRSRARTNELGRVFLNLLVNAAQAIPEGNASLNRIVVTASARAGEVVVEVRDSGLGVARHVRERIFDAFFTTKPVGVGMGLGLSIARSIVEGAGGRIEFESEEGRGATFRVRLPAVSPVSAAAPYVGHAPGSLPPRARRRVLVIDDEPLIGRSLERLLGRVHDVTVLLSAADALHRIDRGERWDAILCDFMMADLDGIGFYEALSARERGSLLRLAFITGGAFGERATRFLAEHDVPVLQKPLDPSVLLEMVEKLSASGASGRFERVGASAASLRGRMRTRPGLPQSSS
jgi:CheY-like chemotaxis protein